MTVLIVDDELEIRRMLVQAFGDEGLPTATAANGKEALAHMRAAAQLPSLILLDMMMPVMNGAQFWYALRSNPDWARVPVILLSAGIYLRQAGLILPVVAMMSKPIDLDQLLRLALPYCTRVHARALGQRPK